MENNPSAAAAAAQGLVLHTLLVACARRAPGLADEIVGLIDALRAEHAAALNPSTLPLFGEELAQWTVKVQNLPEG